MSSLQKKILKNRTRIDTSKYKTLEALLYEWIKQKRSLGICISGPIIKEKALYFNEELKGAVSFKASEGWLEKIKKIFGIRQVNVQGERLSADKNGLFVKSHPEKTLLLAEEKKHQVISNQRNGSQ